MKKYFYFASAALLCGMLFTACTSADNPVGGTDEKPAATPVVATFEDVDVTLNDKDFWNGGQIGEGEEGDWGEINYACKATTGLITANVTYSYMEYAPGVGYDFWGGVAVSRRTGTTLANMDDQYNNIVGSGANGSQTFGVVYGNGSTIDINVEGGAEVSYLYVANNAYTMQNVLVGDGYSPKFANDGDHIYLNIEATKADGSTLTETVKLAEFTTSLSYLTGWEKVDLSAFGKDVVKLTFNFDAHNSGVPLYACIDDVAVLAE